MNERLYIEGEVLDKGYTTKTDGKCNTIVVPDPDWFNKEYEGFEHKRKTRSKCSNFTPKKTKRRK